MTPHAQAEADYCDSGACGGACTDQSVPPIPTFVDTFCCRAELPCVTHQAEAVVRACTHTCELDMALHPASIRPGACAACLTTALQAAFAAGRREGEAMGLEEAARVARPARGECLHQTQCGCLSTLRRLNVVLNRLAQQRREGR